MIVDNLPKFLSRIHRELREKKVIDLTVKSDITESCHVDDAQGCLLDHTSIAIGPQSLVEFRLDCTSTGYA